MNNFFVFIILYLLKLNKIKKYLILLMGMIKLSFVLLLKIISCKIIVHLIPFTKISNLTNPFNYSNIINDLNQNSKRTFIILNPDQFENWVSNNNNYLNIINKLITQKQLEFIIDGINEDREKDNYINLISGIRKKINFILSTLNAFPTVSFFLSQESTTLENMNLYRKMGFKYLILNKINIQFKNELMSEKNLEFKWKISKEDTNGFFTHIINEISTPEFLKDFSSDKEMDLSNNSVLENYTKNLIEYANKTLNGFRHNNLLFLFGGNDSFNEGKFNFENIEKLMNYINQNEKYKDIIEIYFSTFENYFHFVEHDLQNQSLLIYDKPLPLSNNYEKKWLNFYINNPYLRGREYEINNFMNSLFIFNNDLLIGKKINTTFDPIQKNYLEKINMELSINSQEQLFNDYETSLKQNVKDSIKQYYNIPNDELIVCLSNNKVNLGCKIGFTENKKSYRLGIINPGLEGKILITLETDLNETVNFRIIDRNNKEVQFNFICIPNYKCYINFFYNFYKSHSIIQISIIDIKKGTIKNKQKFDNKNIELKGFDKIFKKFEFNCDDSSFYIELKDKKIYKFSINEVLLNSDSNDLIYNDNIIKYKINYQESFIIDSEISKSLLLLTENDYLLFNIYKDPFFIQIISLIFENIDNNKIIGLTIDSNINNEGKIYHDKQGIKMEEYNINYNNNINNNIFVVHKALSLFSKENNKKITLFIDRPNIGVSHKEGSLMYILNHKNEILRNQKLEFRFILTIDEIFHEDVNEISKKYFEKNLLIFYYQNNSFYVPNSLIRNLRLFEENKLRKLQNNQNTNLQYYFDTFDFQNIYFKYAYSIQNYIYSSNINLRIFYFSEKKILLEFYNEIDEYFIQNVDSNFKNIKNFISTVIQGNIFECCIRGVNCKSVNNNSQLRKLHSFSDFAKYEIEKNEFKVFIINF